MAKITIEDCLDQIPNRFILTLAAAQRARELHRGDQSVVKPMPHEKQTVTALREIASGKLSKEKIAQLSRDHSR